MGREHPAATREERWRELAGRDFLGSAGGRVGRFFQGLAIPMGKLGAGFVSGLTKVKERGCGRWGAADIVIHQNELVELRVVHGGVWADAAFAEAWGLGSHVGIEGWSLDAGAGPEADTADLGNRLRA